ncbi:MAG: GGDEF domain-containing protein [Erysipelotrichia bacterium]|nr:GGDEF domain-containing protein [Erysipelotrichia bacterium]NCC53990.1 GGDEF domain-containing protein [Erysipelotrichia bacterium]
MRTKNENQLFSQLLEKENEKISRHWLAYHYYINLGIICMACFLEFIMFFTLKQQAMINVDATYYFIKYLLFPSILNFIIILICTLVIKKSNHLAMQYYTNAIGLVFICFILSFVHSQFGSIDIIYVVAILMTIIYGNYKLTLNISVLSIILKFSSTQFIVWDPHKFQNEFQLMDNLMGCLCLAGFCAIAVLIIKFERRKQIRIIRKDMERYDLKRKVEKDALTKVFNRYALTTYFQTIVEYKNKQVYMALLDIDDFKAVNDTYGHLVGDDVLIFLANILLSYGEQIVPFRFGGDEFCLLFINKTSDEVQQVCEEIRCFYQKGIAHKQGEIFSSLSIGIAKYLPSMHLEQLISKADQALYEAKKTGKNQINI